MADIFEALIGSPPTDKDRQAAIAELLRRRSAFGGVAQATGDPVLSRMGAGMSAAAMDQAGMLQQSGQFAARQASEQANQMRMQGNQERQFELQQQAQDLTRRGQDIGLAETMAQIEAQKLKGTAPKAPTEGMLSARGYLNRMQAATPLLTGSPDAKDYVAFETQLKSGPLMGLATNAAMSDQGKKYYQAAQDWVRAKLRKESGAVISPQEMLQEIRTYFPMPNDPPEVIAQKEVSRFEAENQMRIMGGVEALAQQTATKGGSRLTPQQRARLEELRKKRGAQ